MTHIDIESALDLRGRTVHDRDGEKVGTLKEVFLDESERPAWASVHTGLLGLRESFVPLADVRRTGDDVQVPYTRAEVKDAPSVDPDVQLSPDEEDRLYAHYGSRGTGASGAGGREPLRADDRAVDGGAVRDVETTAADRREHVDEDERVDVDLDAPPERGVTGTREDRAGGGGAFRADAGERAAPTRAAAEGEVVRSEEELDVGTEVRERKVRLRKVVVDDVVTKQVPVQREEIVVEEVDDDDVRRR